MDPITVANTSFQATRSKGTLTKAAAQLQWGIKLLSQCSREVWSQLTQIDGFCVWFCNITMVAVLNSHVGYDELFQIDNNSKKHRYNLIQHSSALLVDDVCLFPSLYHAMNHKKMFWIYKSQCLKLITELCYNAKSAWGPFPLSISGYCMSSSFVILSLALVQSHYLSPASNLMCCLMSTGTPAFMDITSLMETVSRLWGH